MLTSISVNCEYFEEVYHWGMGSPHWLGRCFVTVAVTVVLLSQLVLAAQPSKKLKRQPAYLPDYSTYHTMEATLAEVDGLVKKHGAHLRVAGSCRSTRGHPIQLLHLSNHLIPTTITGRPKTRILLIFGEHAREFITVEAFLVLMKKLLPTYGTLPGDSNDGDLSRILFDHVDLYMIGLLNPDGREIIENSKDYCWRGNHNGVDLNRNFDWNFGGPGSDYRPKSEEYNGGRPFSEVEAECLLEWIQDIVPTLVVSVHSGAQVVFFPYADSVSKQIRRTRNTTALERSIAKNIVAGSNGFFKDSGAVYEKNDYVADGTIFDYAAGVMQVPLVFVTEIFEYKGDDTHCFEFFNPEGNSPEMATVFAEVEKMIRTMVAGAIEYDDRMAAAERGRPLRGLGVVDSGSVVASAKGSRLGQALCSLQKMVERMSRRTDFVLEE